MSGLLADKFASGIDISGEVATGGRAVKTVNQFLQL